MLCTVFFTGMIIFISNFSVSYVCTKKYCNGFLLYLYGCTFCGLQSKKDTAILTHDSAYVSKILDTATPVFDVPDSTQVIYPHYMDSATMLQASPQSVAAFAKTLIGVPYKYASSNPIDGFDCSGFITYVFNYFRMEVPRSSVDFTNYGMTIPKEQATTGDLILFTGTNPEEKNVGHMGIILENTDSLRFIHSSSGKAMGVTITALNDYYMDRFVKTIRVFK